MDYITLKYNATAKPVLADRNGEAIVNWTAAGNHSIDVSTMNVHSGTKSFVITATGVGDHTSNYGKLPSASFATMVVGNQYAVTFWVFGTNGTSWTVECDGTTKVFTVTNTGWTGITLLFTAAHTTANLFIYCNNSSTNYLWFDDITVTQATKLNVYSVKGFDEPDKFEMFPAVQKIYVDGSAEDQNTTFRRLISFDAGVVSSSTDRRGILYWTLDNNRQLDYGSEFQISVALPKSGTEFYFDWLNGLKYGRRFQMTDLQETIVRTVFPV